jgi:hypothetical protein
VFAGLLMDGRPELCFAASSERKKFEKVPTMPAPVIYRRGFLFSAYSLIKGYRK